MSHESPKRDSNARTVATTTPSDARRSSMGRRVPRTWTLTKFHVGAAGVVPYTVGDTYPCGPANTSSARTPPDNATQCGLARFMCPTSVAPARPPSAVSGSRTMTGTWVAYGVPIPFVDSRASGYPDTTSRTCPGSAGPYPGGTYISGRSVRAGGQVTCGQVHRHRPSLATGPKLGVG